MSNFISIMATLRRMLDTITNTDSFKPACMGSDVKNAVTVDRDTWTSCQYSAVQTFGIWPHSCSTDISQYLEVWPFVPVAKDLKDLLKPVGGHWSLIWDKTHHWGDSFFLVHCQPLTNRKAVQGTLNCFPIGQLVVPDLTISTQISNLFSHL